MPFIDTCGENVFSVSPFFLTGWKWKLRSFTQLNVYVLCEAYKKYLTAFHVWYSIDTRVLQNDLLFIIMSSYEA